jgi:hypothetical protein
MSQEDPIAMLKQAIALLQRTEILLNELNAKLDRLESPKATPEWVDKHTAAVIVGGKHWKTLDKWRSDPSKGLRENIHWLNDGGEIVYHAKLLKDWYRHRSHPETHLKTIANFAAKLPANQPQKRTRKVS